MREVSDTRAGDFLREVRPAIDRALDVVLGSGAGAGDRLHAAMRYSVFAGGKRLRPSLAIAACQTFRDDDGTPAVPVAAALELIHTYSLIHDDLPAMDDDDTRRGRPSCHKQFGEATAILAGDGLLTLAFETLASADRVPAAHRLELTRRISRAAGASGGMISGQSMDLEAQGRGVTADHLERIHRAKTGALFEVSIVSGAIVGGASHEELRALEGFGRSLGLAFQVSDDILDTVAATDELGKTSRKDARQGKATYPGIHGPDASYEAVRRLTADALEALGPVGARADLLISIARYLETRTC